jgi:hypothetical protein
LPLDFDKVIVKKIKTMKKTIKEKKIQLIILSELIFLKKRYIFTKVDNITNINRRKTKIKDKIEGTPPPFPSRQKELSGIYFFRKKILIIDEIFIF